MNTIETPTLETTVGDLVARRPSRSRVFEKLGIDYCCGGKKTLAQACAEKAIDAGTVLTILLAVEDAAPAADRDWTNATLTELADHIVETHHAHLKRELPRLAAISRRVAIVHGEHYPWVREFESVYMRFATDMQAHMMKEEQVLFPLIQSLERGEPASNGACGHGVGSPIRVMEDEHDDAAACFARMRELSSEFTPPPDACNTFRAMLDGVRELESDTHRHVHLENSILFPKAVGLEDGSGAATVKSPCCHHDAAVLPTG